MDQTLSKVKLAAWVHDPGEKALVLMRDPEGHEGGTVRALSEKLLGGPIGGALKALVKSADHWAAAADRPQFPLDEEERPHAAWTRAHFCSQPVLVHPLSGT